MLNEKLLIPLTLIFLLVSITGSGQSMSGKPFTKENLLSALEYGRQHRENRKPASWYIERIEKEKVDFQLTPDDERKIRRHGKYLGNEGLNKLINAVRTNYRPTPETTQRPADRESTGRTARNFTDEQKIEMVKLLRPHSGAGILIVKMGGEEGLLFAEQIKQVFQAAGWGIGEGEYEMHAVRYGLVLHVPDPQHLSPAADAIHSAFQKANFRVAIDAWPPIVVPLSYRMRVEAQGVKMALVIGSNP